ncbi:amino acid adenylation domain-containing protein [Methanobrevibacter sp.]|uniref:amino acid adenylation domain-containing protein n=1 Tax=Methanobrevibacter sp. TaxID=66852 RepID=UPI00388FBF70
MNDKTISFNEHLSELWECFDESTLISPNKNGDRENGKIDKSEYSIEKENLIEFANSNSISISELLLAGLTLTLNKFNFSHETLIFNENNVPFATKLETRDVSIKKFLEKIHENYDISLHYDEYYDSDEFLLKPEFYYSFNQKDCCGEFCNYLSLIESDEFVSLLLYYNNELYTKDFIDLFLSSLEKIINQIIGSDISKTNICDIAIENDDGNVVFDEVDLPFIHKRFERQVEETPDNTALIASDATLTYEELNQKANRISNALIKKGVKPKSNILIMLPRNSNLISAILGVLKAGCAFIPIDIEYPKGRIRYIFENSNADYLISNACIEQSIDVSELLLEEDVSNPQVDISPQDLAYMIYTSGSTGNPKGVMITHKNITNLFSKSKDNIIYNAYMKMNKILALSTVSFDAFLLDFMSLTFGLEVVLANDNEIKNIADLTDLIKREKPDSLPITVPSRLRQYMEYDEFVKELNDFRYIALGGEMIPHDLVVQLLEFSDLEIFNLYGPTEVSVTCNGIKITDADNITVGKALHNFITEVRDIDGKLVPSGVMGELYIGGVGVGKGYYNMEDKTREVFLTINGIAYYKSGDYAIKLPNDELVIKGRIDNQIKLRGLRIEIAEIEKNINRFPNIKQAAVAIKEINNNEHLCAYYTAESEIDSRSLKDYLKNKLTYYMVPTVFMQIDEMPQAPNGKTDVKKLPTPSLALDHVEAENETEEKLFELVSAITNTNDFGTTNDLYSLGFSSLTLMQLNSMIWNETGVKLDISSILDKPTIKSLARSIDNYIESIDVDEIIDLAKEKDYFPLTSSQLGIYYECMQNLEEIKYSVPYCMRFKSSIDPIKLKEAIITTIESHPYLKTRIVNTDDGELKQKRVDDIAIEEIEIVEVDEITNEELVENDVRSFDLIDNQLFRFKIYKTPSQTVLFSDLHHIITDGVSHEILFEDIARAYHGEEIEKEKIDGYTYSLIEQINSENEVSKKYFQNKLNQGIESTVLTSDLNGNPDIGEIKLVEHVFDSTFFNHFCQDHALSMNVLFMSATILALNKFTFSDKSLITTIYNGRANPDYFNTQGMLVKTIPIIVDGENREMMVEDFLDEVNRIWKESLIHSNYPYTKLAEDYGLKPEFFYAYHQFFKSDEVIFEGESYFKESLDGSVEIEYKINLNIYDEDDKIRLVLEYNDQLYSEEYINKFIDAINFIFVQFFIYDLDKLRLCDLKLKNDDELHEFSEVELPFLHKRFERQVGKTPNDIALIANDATLTYDELNQKANRVANALIKKGIRPNANVLVMLPRNSNLISSIFGVLKAGCTYIPIDIEYPKGRIDYIFENSQADYIISDGRIENSIDVKDLLMEENVANPQVEISCDDLAYMIYTSGSTGNPKGVMISHENITNLYYEGEDSIIYDAYSKMHRTLAISSVSFDPFLLDLMPLTLGLEMVLANDSEMKSISELTDLIKRQKPDSLTFSAPSRLKQYLEYDEFAKEVFNIRYVGIGGEMVPKDLVLQLLEYPDLDVYNIYGPTETTVTCNIYKLKDADNLTVGKALHNYITEVRDIDGKLVPSGIIGELYIGGIGVGKGYWDMEEKTKESFITINDIPYYKSGDYAMELPNGDIVIKGRIDNQIKLRGLRIEIGEVESVIGNYPGIKWVVVVIKEIYNNEHLCAYFTAENQIDTVDLKAFIAQYLTRYMVPTVFMQLDEMPMSPNGKTDIKQFPEPKLDLEYVVPQTPLEQMLCAIFSSVLGIETVGAKDNFFEIGGTSLIASKLILELIKRNYGVKYEDIFNNQTPRQLAKFLSKDYEVKEGDFDINDDYDYSAINNLLSENTVESFNNGENQEIGNVLLIGVTGYLGIHVLYEYLKNEEGNVYCMMREGEFSSCRLRLEDLMNYYFDEDLSDLLNSRVILTEGDITNLDDFKKLKKYPIDTIINCAAVVKHYTADNYIFKVNVDGVINGIKFAKSMDAQFVQISTLSVLSPPKDEKLAGDVQFDEKTLYYGQDLTNKYVNSKFLAERKVLEAAINGLDVKIIRIGNLMGRYRDGVFQKNYDTNAFLSNVKSIKNIQAISNSMYNAKIEMSPIDWTAKAILKLAKTPKECRVFNCQNNNFIHNKDLIDALNSLGYEIKQVTNKEFVEICRENLDENIQGMITSDMSFEDSQGSADAYETRVNINQTIEILHELGFNWPKPDQNYLIKFIGYLDNLGFFN